MKKYAKMHSIEAAMHFGICQQQPPASDEIRTLIINVVTADLVDYVDAPDVVSALIGAYNAIRVHECWEDDEEEPELLSYEEAEKVFHAAYCEVMADKQSVASKEAACADPAVLEDLVPKTSTVFTSNIVDDIARLAAYHHLSVVRSFKKTG